MARRIEGQAIGESRRFALVISRFNEFVTARLRDGAVDCLRAHGVDDRRIDEIWVPGSFEIPLAAKTAARTKRYDALICLGAIIRGETPHFEFIAAESAHGVGAVARETDVPTIFGILTTNSVEQAVQRAGKDSGNKGWDAALAALEMVTLLEAVEGAEA